MIATITLNPAVDYTVRIDTLPGPDEIARTDTTRLDPGGKGINVSMYLDALGTATVATGLVGGVHGDYLQAALERASIPHDFVETERSTRLNTTVLTSTAEYKINQTGPVGDDSQLDAVVAVVERHDPEMVLIAGSLPEKIKPSALTRIARAGSWSTVIDVDGQALGELTEGFDICKPNRTELSVATNRPVESVSECLSAAKALRENGDFEVVVGSLDTDGAILATETQCLHAPAVETDVVDTTGGGDALLAGFLSARDDGGSYRDALRLGIELASCVVAVRGTSLPRASVRGCDPTSVPVTPI
ncbi:hexose kinase [Halocatena halophila]|uniref:hexose kinase n=1 Tax=Halocatena halophila TaxID=2814576 RepID=UPI002ED32BEB